MLDAPASIRNTIRGGSEDDQISANNGVVDHIDCGTGGEFYGDYAQVDLNGLDKVAKDCERVEPLQVPDPPVPPSG